MSVVVGAALSVGCRSVPASMVRVGAQDPGGRIRGLTACEGEASDLALDPGRPLVLFVPGRGDPGDRYAELAWRFARQGAQVTCFEYDDRESLDVSSAGLIQALEQLEARLPPGRITLIGHSQGGLVARRALIAERPDRLRTAPGFSYTLVAVAAPFAGVRSAADCGRTWLHVLTLGASALVCSMIAGDAWRELPPGSPFMRAPGTLLPEVSEAIGVVTQERGACRRRTVAGDCDESDKVFSAGEQRNRLVEADPRWTRVEVAAGHEEIVGYVGSPPLKLLSVLEARGVLQPLPDRVARP